MADKDYAGLLNDALSPVTAAGMDPDEARANPSATLAKLRGSDPNVAAPESWLDQIRQEANAPGKSSQPQQVAAAAPAAATPPTTSGAGSPADVTRSGNPKNWSDIQRGIVGGGQSSMQQAAQALGSLASQPALEQETAPLQQLRDVTATKLATNTGRDPLTGKTLDQYKPGFGTRLMRGIEGFARGGVLGVIDPAVGGGQEYGAPDRRYGMEQQQTQQQLAGIDQQLAAKQAAFKAATDRAKTVATESRANAQMQKDLSDAVTKQEGAENNAAEIPIRQEQADNASPEAKARLTQLTWGARGQQADQMGLKGQNRTLFMLNGKVPDPRQATEGEIAQSRALQAWQRDNPGKQPGLEDVRQINEAASGRADKAATSKAISPALAARITDEKNNAIQAAATKYRAGFDAKSGGKYGQQDYQHDLQAAQDKYEEAIEAAGGSPQHMTVGNDLSWKPAGAPTSSAPSQAPPAAAKSPATVAPPPGATAEVVDASGKVIGHAVNGQFVPLRKGE